MRVKVSFEIEVPEPTLGKICKDDVEEWVNFELNAIGGMSGGNPLCMTDIDADNVTVDEI